MAGIRKHRPKQGMWKLIAILVVFVFLLSALIPTCWMVLSSFKTKHELFTSENPLWLADPTLEEYRSLLELTSFPKWFLNTLIVSFGATLISIVFGSMAAYGMSRTPSRITIRIAQATLLTYLIPRAMFAIPFYILLNSIGLLNTLVGVIMSYLTFTLPFTIWLLLGFFEGIPKDLDDSALVDGCTRMGILIRIVLPLAGPGLVATAIYCLAEAWNEFLYPLALLQTQENTVLTVGIASLRQGDVFAWGQIMGAGVLATIPILLFFMQIYRKVVGGLATGAVKG
jgi:ABC-type glycerol-3-phosphate transport system permease component